MNWNDANVVVEELRCDTRLYLPALSLRRGFSSSRVEHLLNGLVRKMPREESYLEVGTLEGRTLAAAALGNEEKRLFACDPCEKYDVEPEPFQSHVTFLKTSWRDILKDGRLQRIGLAFYDGLHDSRETWAFMENVKPHLADEAVLVLDDWDRQSVRHGAFSAAGWQLLRECPEYTDGLTTAQHHFGYSFGLAVFGFRR